VFGDRSLLMKDARRISRKSLYETPKETINSGSAQRNLQ
jgi:hypothetical protein